MDTRTTPRALPAPRCELASNEPQLRHTFRKRDGIALIVSNVVGVGIFTTPCVVAALVPHAAGILSLWLVGGFLALAGASCYARLARRWPSAGGEYVYLSKTYGPAAGFLSGWTSLIAGFSGSVAVNAVALVLFAGHYFPSLAANQLLVATDMLGFRAALTSRSIAAALVIAFLALLHMRSMAAGKHVQNLLAVLLVGMIAALVAAGFASKHGSWTHFQASPVHFGTMNWLLALVPVMFAYSGWNAAVYVSEEIHASRKSIRPILLGGTAAVVVLYFALNSLYLYAMTPAQMLASSNIAETAARVLLGMKADVITPVMIVALLGAASALTIAGPRIYFAMARDGVFIPVFGKVNVRYQTPALAIALQAAWSIALVLVGGFEQILMYTGFAVVLSSGAAVAGLFFAHGDEDASARRWTQLVIPAIFVIACAAMVIDTMLDAPKIALVGVLLIATGLPAYALCRRKVSREKILSPAYKFQPEEVSGD